MIMCVQYFNILQIRDQCIILFIFLIPRELKSYNFNKLRKSIAIFSAAI